MAASCGRDAPSCPVVVPSSRLFLDRPPVMAYIKAFICFRVYFLIVMVQKEAVDNNLYLD